jgi:hypothetical protein
MDKNLFQVCTQRFSRMGVRAGKKYDGMDEGGTDLVQVAEMHDPNTGAAQVCAGGVPLASTLLEARSGFEHTTGGKKSTTLPRDGNVVAIPFTTLRPRLGDHENQCEISLRPALDLWP